MAMGALNVEFNLKKYIILLYIRLRPLVDLDLL